MNFIFRNVIRTGIAMTLMLAYTLNPETAQWQDLFHLLLRSMHSSAAQQVFMLGWVLFSALDVALSGFSEGTFNFSLPTRGSIIRSHSISYVEKKDD